MPVDGTPALPAAAARGRPAPAAQTTALVFFARVTTRGAECRPLEAIGRSSFRSRRRRSVAVAGDVGSDSS